jgi:hypothetical protein
MTSAILSPEPEPIILGEPAAVAAFVDANLHVTTTQLWDALSIGMAEAALTTEHSTAGAFGTRLWDGTAMSLRDQLKPAGWNVLRPGGLEVVRRSDGALQITPSLGNEHTGVLSGGIPKWKYQRGVSTKKAINENQLSLADLAPEEVAFRPIQTWWLLYRVFVREGEKMLRAEISLPVDLNRRGAVRWAYRLLLGERSFGDTRSATIPAPAPDPQIVLARRSVRS